MKPSERVIILKPHPMGWLYLFVLCALAIPLFGLGLVAGFFLLRHIRGISYRLSDWGMELHRDGHVTSLTWEAVSNATAVSRAGRLGHVVLHTAQGDIRMLFLEDAFGLAETIQAMLDARKAHLEERFEPRESETGMGNDRLNDLTALWQQGLISEEDYLAERKHFT